MTDEEDKQAEKLGFVVVFGYSDDNAELRGAIYDEVGCFDGGEILLDRHGIIEDCDCRYGRIAKENAKKIEAIWNEENYSWTYKTDIPHATFDIYDDGEKFCRGIVFEMEALK